jgi:chromosome segregation ATPase
MLTAIQVEQFRNIEDTQIDVAPGVTFLFGANEAGKSSVLEAVRWALTGRAHGTDAAGKGAGKLVRDGARQASVTLHFLLNGRAVGLTRTVTTSGKTSLMPSTIDVAGVLGTPSLDVLDAALDGERLLSADHATAKALLLRLIQPEIVDPVDGQRYTLDTINQAEAAAREERLGLKRAIQALGEPRKPLQPKVTPDDLVRLKSAVTDAKRALDAELRASDRDAGRREELTRRLNGLRGAPEVATAERHLADAKSALAAAVAAMAERPADADLEAARRRMQDARVEAAKLDQQIQTLQAFSDGHSAIAGCVLNASIPCHTPAKEFAGTVRDLTAWARRVGQISAEAEADVAAWEAAERVAAHAERTRRDAEARVTAAERALERARERAEVDAALAALPTPDTSARDNLAAAVTAASSAYERAQAIDRAWTQYRADAERAESLQNDLAIQEARCTRLGPKGIRVAALASAVTDWLSVVNRHTARLNGHVLDLSIDPWRLLVDGRDAVLLSASARLRVAVAIQIAMRAPVVLVDAADLLDEANTIAFAAWLHALGTSVQVIVTATRPATVTAPTWARSYWLESGSARPLAVAAQ